MAQIVTETGRTFGSENEALDYMRACSRIMLEDPDVTHVESGKAAIEMLYTFRALDEHLSGLGRLPWDWEGQSKIV